MKVKTMIMLDEDVKGIVKKHLAGLNMSLSAFINGILAELAREIEGQPVMMDKPMKDMTLEEFSKLASYWMQKASEG